MHHYRCEMDLALTYSMRRPALARECAQHAISAARALGRPDLLSQACELLSLI
jgi:hypothetical protein